MFDLEGRSKIFYILRHTLRHTRFSIGLIIKRVAFGYTETLTRLRFCLSKQDTAARLCRLHNEYVR